MKNVKEKFYITLTHFEIGLIEFDSEQEFIERVQLIFEENECENGGDWVNGLVHPTTVDDCCNYIDNYCDNFILSYRNWSVEKKDLVERSLIDMWSRIGMGIPNNYEDIVQYVYEDVCETADPVLYNDSDVVIGFRRWIESQ